MNKKKEKGIEGEIGFSSRLIVLSLSLNFPKYTYPLLLSSHLQNKNKIIKEVKGRTYLLLLHYLSPFTSYPLCLISSKQIKNWRKKMHSFVSLNHITPPPFHSYNHSSISLHHHVITKTPWTHTTTKTHNFPLKKKLWTIWNWNSIAKLQRSFNVDT